MPERFKNRYKYFLFNANTQFITRGQNKDPKTIKDISLH